MKTLVKILIIFLLLSLTSSILLKVFHVNFGTINFWDKHGLFFLLFITFFPRLTLFFSSVPFGGLLWWLGFFFCPRLLIAILATLAYWHTNTFLVLCSWFVALSGETSEKYVVHSSYVRTRRLGKERFRREDIIDV